MHALGFAHTQSHPERNKYITILTQNIIPRALGNFRQTSAKEFGNFGTEYDFGSVMHYGPKFFSKNGKDTIKSLIPDKTFGQRKGMSLDDVKRINTMYECSQPTEIVNHENKLN